LVNYPQFVQVTPILPHSVVAFRCKVNISCTLGEGIECYDFQLGEYGVCGTNIFFTFTFYNNGDSTLEELSAQRKRGGEGAEELNMEVAELNPGGKTIVTEMFFCEFLHQIENEFALNATAEPD
jgi:hypothetical protein